MWGVPPRNNLFTGREEQLTQLHDKLFNQSDKNNSDINQSSCGIKKAELGGIGGVGKTQLSVEYCHRHFGSKYGFVVMVRAESQASISQEMRRLAVDLGLLGNEKNVKKGNSGGKLDVEVEVDAEKNGKFLTGRKSVIKNMNGDDADECAESLMSEFDDDEVVEIVKRKLSRCRYRWLIIFDNVADSSIVNKYLPRGQLNQQFSSSSPPNCSFSTSTSTSCTTSLSSTNRDFSRCIFSPNLKELAADSTTKKTDSLNYSDKTEKTEKLGTIENEKIEYDKTLESGPGSGPGTGFEGLGGGHVIITTRASHDVSGQNKSLGSFNHFDYQQNSRCASSILLECFNKAESMQFLDISLQMGGNDVHTTSKTTSSTTSTPLNTILTTTTGLNGVSVSGAGSDELRSLSVLADRMGHLPLALAMVSAYLTRCDVSACEYLSRLDNLILHEEEGYDNEEEEEEGEEGECIGGKKKSNSGHDNERESANKNKVDEIKSETKNTKKKNVLKSRMTSDIMGANDYSVVSSLSISLDRIKGESEAALCVLFLLSFLSPDGVTKKLVRLLLEIGYYDKKQTNSGINGLLVVEVNDRKEVNKVENKEEGSSEKNEDIDGQISSEVLDDTNDVNRKEESGERNCFLENIDNSNTKSSKIGNNFVNFSTRAASQLFSSRTFLSKRQFNSAIQVTAICSTLSFSFLILPYSKIRIYQATEKCGLIALSFFALFGAGTLICNATKTINNDNIIESEDRQLYCASNIDTNKLRSDVTNSKIGNEKCEVEKSTKTNLLTSEKFGTNPTRIKDGNSNDVTTDKMKNFDKNDVKEDFISQENISSETDRVWQLLKQFSLLSVRGGRNNRVGSIHRLQQSVIRSRVHITGGNKNIRNQLEKCIFTINLMWKFDIKNVHTWEECGSILNHIQCLVEHVRKYGVRTEVSRRFCIILIQSALYYTEVLSRFDSAQYLLENAVLMQSKICDIADSSEKNVPEKITVENNKNTSSVNSNNNEIASNNSNTINKNQRELLEEKSNALHLLGKVFRIRGDYLKAENNLQIALKMRKITLSRKICDTYHELGVLRLRQHEYSSAFIYLTDSLTLKKEHKKEMRDKKSLIKKSASSLTIENKNNNEFKGNNNEHYGKNISENHVEVEVEVADTSEAATLHQLAVIATGEGDYDKAQLLLLKALLLETVKSASDNCVDDYDYDGDENEKENEDSCDEGEKEVVIEVEMENTGESDANQINMIGDEKLKKEYSDDVDNCNSEESEQNSNSSINAVQKREKEKIEKEKRSEIEYLTKKIDKIQKNDEKIPVINRLKSQNSVSRAATLQQLGRVALRRGSLDEAKMRLKESLALYLNAYGLEKFERHINVAAVYHQLGCCFSAMHDFKAASIHFYEALKIREVIYGFDNYNNNTHDNNNHQENGDNENGNIEIIQEIQALGQSEMMVGKLECAEKYFVRQFEMCCKALNLKILKVKNEYTIEFKENFNSVELPKNSNISLSKNDIVLDSVPQPQVKRKRDTLTKFLLFSVYSLKGISRRQNNYAAAVDHCGIVRCVKKMLLSGKKNSAESSNSDDKTGSTQNKQNSGNSIKNNGNSSKNNSVIQIPRKECKKSNNENLELFDSQLSKNGTTENGNDNNTETSEFSENWDSAYATNLLKCRGDLRNVAVVLMESESSVCVLTSALNCCRNIQQEYATLLSPLQTTQGSAIEINTGNVIISRDQKALIIGLKFVTKCSEEIKSVLENQIKQSSNENQENSILAVVDIDKNKLKKCSTIIFEECDSLRSSLRELGLKIEDSQ